jgi:hypothetical protein
VLGDPVDKQDERFSSWPLILLILILVILALADVADTDVTKVLRSLTGGLLVAN